MADTETAVPITFQSAVLNADGATSVFFAGDQKSSIAVWKADGSSDVSFGGTYTKPLPVTKFPFPDRDRHVRRSGDDYAQILLSLLPHGQAWSRDPGTVMVRALWGLAQYYGYVDSRGADLLERESDPRQTVELLSDWEKAWGLPDPCFPSATSIGERQRMLVLKMTMLGGQSREFFEQIAQWLGYSITYIREWSPFMVGVSQVGDTRDALGYYRWEIGPPEMRFYWSVHVGTRSLIWFRCGAGQCGIDPHLRIGLASDLQCLFDRWKPAQTQVIFDYSNIVNAGPMDGTP